MRNSLVILDWDDTCLPSHALLTQSNLLNIPTLHLDFEEYDNKCIAQIEQQLIHFIQKSKHSNIYIVTNAEHKWVTQSCDLFYPDLYQVIREYNIPIISARDKYMNEFPDSVEMWKLKTIEEIVKLHPMSQLISIGDSYLEKVAATKCVDKYRLNCECRLKIIKLLEKPKLIDLLFQWNIILTNIERIMMEHTDLDIVLEHYIENIINNLSLVH